MFWSKKPRKPEKVIETAEKEATKETYNCFTDLNLEIQKELKMVKPFGGGVPVLDENDVVSNVEKTVEKPVKHHVLYDYDGEIFAVGPFSTLQEAKYWLSGFNQAADDDYVVIGVVTALIPTKAVKFVDPEDTFDS